MPLYEYELINDDGTPGDRFELMQKFEDEPLTKHPESGQPCRRVISAPYVAGSHSQMAIEKGLKNDDKMANMGFTKYVKSDNGYEKAYGSGPDLPKID